MRLAGQQVLYSSLQIFELAYHAVFERRGVTRMHARHLTSPLVAIAHSEYRFAIEACISYIAVFPACILQGYTSVEEMPLSSQ